MKNYKKKRLYVFRLVDGFYYDVKHRVYLVEVLSPLCGFYRNLWDISHTDITCRFVLEDASYKFVFVNGCGFVRIYQYWK